ncbi:AAA family ATPase [Agrilactobacillus yilanensis]|uniref:AAA family ATPase n=1 Tax=Agrilactobacillus yilanensis TaxID=2485997 RepID=A0ABW4J3H8_9LACO|nr:AAA family ATPase [Agrilactobacillus yilanensis]
MIELKDVNTKSFHNYSFNGSFDKVNLFFGQNGSGKTALSGWISALDFDHTRVFDTVYVEQEVRNTETMSGSKIIVGKEQIESVDKINHCQKIISTLESDTSPTTELENARSALVKIMTEEIGNAKVNFRSNAIHQKANARSNPIRALEQWKDEIHHYKDVKSDFSSFEGIDQAIRQLTADRDHLVPILQNYDQAKRKKFIAAMNTPVLEPESSVASNVAEWLSCGAILHNFQDDKKPELTTCLFCGNKIDPEKVKTHILDRIDTEYAKLLAAIGQFQTNLTDSLTVVDGLQATGKVDEKQIDAARIQVTKLEAVLKDKRNHTDQNIALGEDVFSAILTLNNTVNQVRDEIDNKLNQLRHEQDNIEKLAKRSIGLALQKRPDVGTTVQQIRRAEKNIDDENRSIEITKDFLKKLNEKSSDLEGFLKLMNGTLKTVGMNFHLQFSTNDTSSFEVVENEDNESFQFHSLSEGEVRLVAFVKFYFSLFSEYKIDEETQSVLRKIDPTIRVIILDDPITSVDSNNRYFMTSLINSFLDEFSKGSVETFVFTHSLYDFHNIAYLMNGGVAHFRVTKDVHGESEVTAVESDSMKNFSDDYHSTFIDVANFAMLGKQRLAEKVNYLHFGNQCRFLLETHARSNYNIENATNNALSQILDVYNVPKPAETQVRRMLDTINSLSHGMSFNWDYTSGIPAKEIQQAARTLLWMLSNKDQQHVEAMARGLSGLMKSCKTWQPVGIGV